MQRGEVVRFYLTNAANTRTFNLSFPGARMKVVGSDVGPYAREEWVESVVIAPAERYVVHVRFDRPGVVPLVNRVRGLDHLYGRFFAETDTLGTVAGRAGSRREACRGAFAALRRDTAAAGGDGAFRRRAAGRAREGAGAHAGDPGPAARHPAADAARLDLLLARWSGAARCR